ncbi:MAG: META domain-containing protein [Anaerolineae bacterium]|nr:META domain-containing protein [Anaerolineae bacterium]
MKKLVLFVFVALLLAACGGDEPTPTPTVAAPSVVVATATATPIPTVSFCKVVDPSQIHLNTLGLPYPYQVNCVPEKPYDASMPPGPVGLPEHIQINFATLDPAAVTPLDPIIYIIPAQAYVDMWDAAGNPVVSQNMQLLRDLVAAKPQAVPTSGNPILPMELATGFNDLAVQGSYLDFGNWDGIRFVGRFEQSPNPVTNQNLYYYFQGFAGENDEVFISMRWPVTTPFLWNTGGDVPQAEMDQVNSDSTAYMSEKATQLNGLAPEDWNPPLSTLDTVIGSLQYGPPETPGLVPTVEIPTPEPQAPYGRITAPAGVNVRSGPGTNFPLIGTAPFGAEGAIIGISADGRWWVTPIQGAPNGQGWVSVDFVQAFNADNVPVIPSPPPPVPTATPTAMPTPAPSINFWVDNPVINQGQCTTLRWNVQNIQAIWVYPQGADFNQWPATGEGSRQVCPTVTTTYEMRVQLTNGSVEFRQLTVTVNQVNPLANTSWALTAMNVTGVLVPGTSVTAFFGSGNALSGFGGCNNYNASYFVTGNSLSIGSITNSLVTCGAEIDQQESLYLSLLRAAATFEIQGATLIVRNAGGQEILRFSRIG